LLAARRAEEPGCKSSGHQAHGRVVHPTYPVELDQGHGGRADHARVRPELCQLHRPLVLRRESPGAELLARGIEQQVAHHRDPASDHEDIGVEDVGEAAQGDADVAAGLGHHLPRRPIPGERELGDRPARDRALGERLPESRVRVALRGLLARLRDRGP
jgi:hypothetical protein